MKDPMADQPIDEPKIRIILTAYPLNSPAKSNFMKSTRNLLLAGSIAFSLASTASHAATFVYSNTTSGTTQWSAGTNWDATPVSDPATTLTFGNAAALAASDAIVSNNDLAGDFKLNVINMTYAGPATGIAPAVVLTGGRLEASTNGATAPTMVFNTTGTVKPVVTINNDLLLTNDLTITATTNAVVGGLISGPGKLSKSGTGVLTITSTGNSYEGNTTLTAGVLEVGDLANNSLGIGGLILNGGVLQGFGTFTRNFNAGGLPAAANGEIAGPSGGFSARGGPLEVNFGGLLVPAQVTLSGPGNRLGNGFILNSGSANNKVTVVNPIALNGAVRVFTVNTGTGGDSAEISGVLSGTTSSGVNKTGSGQLILSRSNTYAGLTTVGAGTLAISNTSSLGAAALGATNNTTSVSSDARLQLISGVVTDSNESLIIAGTGGGIPAGALQAGTGGGTWTGPIALNAAARIGATAGNTLVINGSIADGTSTGVAFSGQSGTGTIVLAPTTSNTYTGQTNLVRGIVRLGKTDALPVTTVLDAKDAANSIDATVLDLAGFNQTIAGLFDTGANANTVITNSVADTVSNLTMNLTGIARTYDGTIADSAGSISLTKIGTVTQTLAGANSYSGATNIIIGALTIANNTALGTTAGATIIQSTGTIATGGRLILTNDITCAEPLTLAGSSEQTGGFNPTVDSTSGINTLSGGITLEGTGGQRINATGSLTITGPIARDGINAGALVLRTGSAVSTLTVDNSIDLNGNGLNIQGLGTVILNAASTDFVSTNISFGGPELVLKLGVDNALPISTDLVLGTTNTTVGSDQGKLDLAGHDQSIRALTGVRSTGISPSEASARKITNSAGTPATLTVGFTTVGGNFSTFDGVIEDGTGGIALTKVGGGTSILSADNTYTGATQVDAGTLRVIGSLNAGSTVNVGPSGILAGTGTVSGTVTAFGTIAPGSGGAGTLSTGATTLTGTLAVEINGANGDKLVSTGAVFLAGPLTVNLLGGGFTEPSYVIAEGTSLSGTFSSVPGGYAVSYSATQATLTKTPGGDYNSWTTSFGLQNPWLGIDLALNGDPAADPDGDGMNNQQEYAFGLTPTSGSSVNPIIVRFDKDAGTFSYTRRATPLTTGLAYIVKTSTDLLSWTPDNIATSNQSVTGTVDGVQTVQVTLSGLPLADEKLFVRIEAQ